MTLLFANQSEADIIHKKRLDELAAKHTDFSVFYIVDKASSKGWKGGVGYITKVGWLAGVVVLCKY